MKKIIKVALVSFCLSFFCLTTLSFSANQNSKKTSANKKTSAKTKSNTNKSKEAILSVPIPIIQDFLKAIIPLEVTRSKFLQGKLLVKKIDNIQIGENQISFVIYAVGEKISYMLELGKQTLAFDIGDIDIKYQCSFKFHFNKEKELLMVTPKLKDLKSKKNPYERLFKVLNNNEFPMELRSFGPSLENFYDSYFLSSFKVTDVYTKNKTLFVGILPQIKKYDFKKIIKKNVKTKNDNKKKN